MESSSGGPQQVGVSGVANQKPGDHSGPIRGQDENMNDADKIEMARSSQNF